MSNIYVGIDPGSDGFICVMDNNNLTFLPMPQNEQKEVDGEAIANFLAPFYNMDKDVYVMVEDVHAVFGSAAGATFQFGKNVGKLLGALEAGSFVYEEVQPKAWQKVMWSGFVIERKQSSTGKTMVNDTKATSIKVALELFPDVDLTKSKRARKPHDGKADALLLAEYCRRKIEKK